MEKVLIVEDEPHARSGLTELIQSWGYEAEDAADGVEGLEKALSWTPAVVVTDLKMPRMDGMELLTRLSVLPQKTAVVMLTAQGSIESAVEAMRRGPTTTFRNRSIPCGSRQLSRMPAGSMTAV